MWNEAEVPGHVRHFRCWGQWLVRCIGAVREDYLLSLQPREKSQTACLIWKTLPSGSCPSQTLVPSNIPSGMHPEGLQALGDAVEIVRVPGQPGPHLGDRHVRKFCRECGKAPARLVHATCEHIGRREET